MEIFAIVAALAAFGFFLHLSYRAGLREGGTTVSKALVRGATDNLSSHRQDELGQIIKQIMGEHGGRSDRHEQFVAAAYEVGSAIAAANKQHGAEFEQDRLNRR